MNDLEETIWAELFVNRGESFSVEDIEHHLTLDGGCHPMPSRDEILQAILGIVVEHKKACWGKDGEIYIPLESAS